MGDMSLASNQKVLTLLMQGMNWLAVPVPVTQVTQIGDLVSSEEEEYV